jgi:hypothetical protein
MAIKQRWIVVNSKAAGERATNTMGWQTDRAWKKPIRPSRTKLIFPPLRPPCTGCFNASMELTSFRLKKPMIKQTFT